MTGSWLNTGAECVNQATVFNTGVYGLIDTAYTAVRGTNAAVNLLTPVYSFFDLLVTASNLGVACMLVTQANQYNLRVKTEAGFSDLVYVVYNIPVEGFFEGKNNASIVNVIWDALSAIYKASMKRRSMNCTDLGFQLGRIWQTLINFDVPVSLYYDQVSS